LLLAQDNTDACSGTHCNDVRASADITFSCAIFSAMPFWILNFGFTCPQICNLWILYYKVNISALYKRLKTVPSRGEEIVTWLKL